MTEKELVYLCKTESNNLYKKILFKRYHESLKWFVYRILQGKFYSIPFDWYELDSFIFECFVKAFKNFNLKQTKYSFSQAIFTITRSRLLSYAIKFMSNKQIIMNNAFSYDAIDSFKRDSLNVSHLDDSLQNENNKVLILKIKKYLSKQPPHVQKIINLKCKDIPNREIAKKLKIPTKKVSNTYNLFILKSRKHFLNSETF